MKRLIISLLIISILSVSSGLVFAEDKIKIMPEELLHVAFSYQCNQINNFFNRPGMVDPPFAYGVYEGAPEDSAVFWCEKKMKNVTEYYLIIQSSQKKNEEKPCSTKIVWRNYPGGLSIYKNTNTTLDGFVYLNNPKKSAPQNAKITHNAIRSYYDGLEELFYCYDGEWLVRQRD